MSVFEKYQIFLLIANVVAIISGPIIAIRITRYLDGKKEEQVRKFQIFSDLMRTRKNQLDPVHVSALNLIPVEFHKNNTILLKHQDYLKHLASPRPSDPQDNRYYEERHDLFLELIHSIGKTLNYDFDRRELDRFGYSPIGWESDQQLARHNAHLLSELLEGHRALPISSHIEGKFPPPPD